MNVLGGNGNKGIPQSPDLGSVVDASANPDVAVNEEVIWKARAQEAEEKLETCEKRIVSLEQELSDTRELIVSVERRAEIDAALSASGTIDLETARLLTEAAISTMDDPDISVAVRELRAKKPYLFERGAGTSSSSVMGSAPASDDDGLGSMADKARGSGDRAELLRYLRARRGG